MTDACDDGLSLQIHSLSGTTATVSSRLTTSPQELCTKIEGLLGMPACSQRWIVENKEILFHAASTLAHAGLKAGDQLTVMHSGFAPLEHLPEEFKLDLTSVRQKFRTGYSSAFTIIYKYIGSFPAGWLYMEPWRKNDHDKLLYDVKAGVRKHISCHWMAGTRTDTSPLESDPIQDFRNCWAARPKRIRNDAERFWLTSGAVAPEDTPEDHRSDAPQARPRYSAVPGWFVAPCEDCDEVEVDVPLPHCDKRIVRLLISREGKPLRAALRGCRMAMLHEDLEEYEISLEACAALANPLPDES